MMDRQSASLSNNTADYIDPSATRIYQKEE